MVGGAVPDIGLVDLYRDYPRFDIDVEIEQELVRYVRKHYPHVYIIVRAFAPSPRL